MKKIKVKLVGVTDLLMNSPKSMLEPEQAIKIKNKKYDKTEEAERVSYRNEEGYLFVPNTAVKGCIINAASYKKVGRHALRPIIAGGVRIPHEEILISVNGEHIKDYDIDLRTVVIQRARVVKSRPRIKNWELNLEIQYNEQLLPDPEVIRLVLEEGGERVGLLDFRPQKTGEFGTFKVAEFEAEE